jgi:aminopeptidase N
MRILTTLVVCFCLFFAGFCQARTSESEPVQSSDQTLAATYQREAEPWLTHEEAILRARTVSNIVYALDINLTAPDVYSANVTIKFDYEPSSFPLTLDFLDGDVKSIIVGSITVEQKSIPIVYNGKFISVAPELLSRGENTIKINYSHSYSETGAGLYRFVDSVDQRVYLYTHFEPYDANRLAPMFDQPNLRARWLFTVHAPKDWVVVTSVREDSVERGESSDTWYFPLSPSLSSYILPLHAGQYHVWEGMAGKTPLRLFARESMAKYVRAEWLLELTANGIAFFEQYFDVPYPFSKYDQLLVPDFNIGGMENVAAVTYTEYSIPRGEPTSEQLQGISNLFLHELAHMWFGDLVTIDWWNALWLKESFASLMAPLAVGKATEFDSPWLTFYLSSKQYAYQADQYVTTHPIEMPVRDTKSGVASFDSITYSKGASVLKQLNHYLGEETFRGGVRAYLSRFGWQAATLPFFRV